MEKIDLQAIEERCEKATPGPWISLIEGRDFQSGWSFIKTAGEDIEMIAVSDEDQDFMASCRQDVPLLINEIRRLRKILDENNIEY